MSATLNCDELSRYFQNCISPDATSLSTLRVTIPGSQLYPVHISYIDEEFDNVSYYLFKRLKNMKVCRAGVWLMPYAFRI